MSKRKNSYRDEYEKEFNNVKRSLKGQCFAHCSFCKYDINLEAIVKAAISAHNATQKHKNSARQTKSNQSVKAFFKSQFAPTTLDYKAAAAEGTWALYTVKHQQSFLSNECTSHLFKTLFPDSKIAKKFASARTKTKSIIIGVLSPYAQKILLSELGTQLFSVSVDVSNHNQLKLFPLVIRFFNAKVGVQVRLLNLRSMPSETSKQIIDFIHTSLQENDLDLRKTTYIFFVPTTHP